MRSLIIRLPNHLGDACMSLPALDRLAAEGVDLSLAGRPWAAELFQAYAWPVVALGARGRDRVGALRAWRVQRDHGRDALLLTNSFSSALEFRLAGLRPTGYATDGRSLLLKRAIALPRTSHGGVHMVQYYLHLACEALGLGLNAAPAPHLRLAPQAQERARAALARAQAQGQYVVLCPVARGRHRGQVKSWEGFGRLSRELVERGHEVVVCPGPGEEQAARSAAPGARFLEALDLGAFGALLSESRLVIANDSGPGHLAAAVGARLVGIFGVTDPTQTRPLGPHVQLVGGAAGWPTYEEVARTVASRLAEG